MTPREQLNIAIEAYHQNRLDEAENLLHTLIEDHPGFADGFSILGVLLITKGNTSGARAYLTKALKMDPGNFSALVNLGNIALIEGNTTEAKAIFLQVLSVQETFLPALINIGHMLTDEGKVGEAGAYYKKAVDAHPQQPDALLAMGRHCLDRGLPHEAYDLLNRASAILPDQVNILLLLGNAAKETGRMDEAEKCYSEVLRLDPVNKGAQQNLGRLLSTSIPRWHFTMLADEQRNAAYEKAIIKAVDNTSNVLDIGAGSGLLSMMAARAGANSVVACEMHRRLAEVAGKIVSDNGFDGKIKVINKKSTDLVIGEDLPEKANLLISEILDAGAVGEGVVHVIRHAKANLLTGDAKIIPAAVHLFGQLVEIPQRSKISPVREISGFDLSAFDQFRVPDEYTSVNLGSEHHKKLSDVAPLIAYDFYDLPTAIQDNMPKVKEIIFPVNTSGMLQAVVFWFDLYLDEKIVVSSRPDGELKHWGQALFCFSNPIEVRKDDKIPIKMIHSDQIIRFALPTVNSTNE